MVVGAARHIHGLGDRLDVGAGEVARLLFGAGDQTHQSAHEAVRHLMDDEFDQLKKAIARERRTGITQDFLAHLIDSTQVLLDFYEVPRGKARPDRVLKAS